MRDAKPQIKRLNNAHFVAAFSTLLLTALSTLQFMFLTVVE
jgi:hypothetical protein